VRDNAELATRAFIALATLAPERFGDTQGANVGAKAVSLASEERKELADAVFAKLEAEAFGPYGADVLFAITSSQDSAKASARAAKLLERADISSRGTPAMRIALRLRDASCQERPSWFDRAGKEGDERALYVLLAMKGEHCQQISCCMKGDERLTAAINAIRSRHR
jgi:hypothetical protein